MIQNKNQSIDKNQSLSSKSKPQDELLNQIKNRIIQKNKNSFFARSYFAINNTNNNHNYNNNSNFQVSHKKFPPFTIKTHQYNLVITHIEETQSLLLTLENFKRAQTYENVFGWNGNLADRTTGAFSDLIELLETIKQTAKDMIQFQGKGQIVIFKYTVARRTKQIVFQLKLTQEKLQTQYQKLTQAFNRKQFEGSLHSSIKSTQTLNKVDSRVYIRASHLNKSQDQKILSKYMKELTDSHLKTLKQEKKKDQKQLSDQQDQQDSQSSSQEKQPKKGYFRGHRGRRGRGRRGRGKKRTIFTHVKKSAQKPMQKKQPLSQKPNQTETLKSNNKAIQIQQSGFIKRGKGMNRNVCGHPYKPHYAKGQCNSCYTKNKRLGIQFDYNHAYKIKKEQDQQSESNQQENSGSDSQEQQQQNIEVKIPAYQFIHRATTGQKTLPGYKKVLKPIIKPVKKRGKRSLSSGVVLCGHPKAKHCARNMCVLCYRKAQWLKKRGKIQEIGPQQFKKYLRNKNGYAPGDQGYQQQNQDQKQQDHLQNESDSQNQQQEVSQQQESQQQIDQNQLAERALEQIQRDQAKNKQIKAQIQQKSKDKQRQIQNGTQTRVKKQEYAQIEQ